MLKDPKPVVQAAVLGEFAINLVIRPWVAVKDFGAAPGEINPEIVRAFRERGIEIPFPTADGDGAGGGWRCADGLNGVATGPRDRTDIPRGIASDPQQDRSRCGCAKIRFFYRPLCGPSHGQTAEPLAH